MRHPWMNVHSDRRLFLQQSAAVVGASTLGLWGCGEVVPVEADASNEHCVQTAADILGPKYRAGAPDRAGKLADDSEPGDRLFLSGTVFADGCGSPLAGAVLDVWQANVDGLYDDEGYVLRGKFTTDASGQFNIETILPGHYTGRPRHIHFIVSGGGHELTTQLYFEGDPFLSPRDPCSTCASDESTIITALTEDTEGQRGVFNIVLG